MAAIRWPFLSTWRSVRALLFGAPHTGKAAIAPGEEGGQGGCSGGHRGTDDDAHSTTACMRTCTTHRNAKMIVPSSHSALGHWAQPQPPPFFIFIRYHTRLVSPTLPISIPPLASWVVGCFPASAASGSSAPRQVREEEEIKKTIEQRRVEGK